MSSTPAMVDTPPEARQFDFWVGEWDLTWEGGSGTNRIRPILDGRVIEEQFHSDDGSLDGLSVSVYSPQLGQWQQTWVDSQSSYIHLTGVWDGARMILATHPTRADQPAARRMVFYNIAADQLDWRWEHTDDGQSWHSLWEIHYRRCSANQPS